MVAAVTGSVLAVGGAVAAFAIAADNRTPPPVSDVIASAYASGAAIKPRATATAAPVITAPAVKSALTAAFAKQAGQPTAATGQPFGIWDNGKNTSGMTVTNGLLVHGDATGTHSASYLEAGIGKPVEKIGAEAVFASVDGGQIALVAWQDSIDAARNKANPDRIPNGGIHFVAGPTAWHLGVYDTNKGERIISSGSINLVADGKTRHRFEVVRKGNQAWIVLPSGATTPPVTDPKLGEWAGEWATWELYENTPGLAPAAFSSVWAG